MPAAGLHLPLAEERDMARQRLMWSGLAVLGLWACGAGSSGDELSEEEARAALVEASVSNAAQSCGRGG